MRYPSIFESVTHPASMGYADIDITLSLQKSHTTPYKNGLSINTSQGSSSRHFCPLLPNFTRVFPGDSWVKLRSHVSCEEISRFTPRCQAPAESASWLTARAKKTHVFRHHGRRYCCCYCRHERHRRPPPHGRPKSTTRATFLQDAIQCISSAYRSSLRRRLDARRRRIAR